MLVTIGLVYMIMVILFGSLLVPFVILSVLIGLLMLRGIVVTNAIVLHEIEASTHLRTALIQGGRTRVRPILMTNRRQRAANRDCGWRPHRRQRLDNVLQHMLARWTHS